jgi:DNA-binding IclR family transcriptional regulator
MSRGLGILQRRVCETLLSARDGYGPSLRELHRLLGEPNRSNLHRSIEGLLRLGLVEASLSGGERRFRLTFLGALQTQLEVENRDHAGPPRPRRATRWEKDLAAVSDEERSDPEVEAPEGTGWVSHEPRRPLRKRPPSEAYKRILSVLWEYAKPWDKGLPVAVVKEIVGGDRSNTRRAIKTLQQQGKLEESEDGKRIRLSPSAAYVFSFAPFPPMPDEPVDDKHARAVLRRHQKKSGRAPR